MKTVEESSGRVTLEGKGDCSLCNPFFISCPYDNLCSLPSRYNANAEPHSLQVPDRQDRFRQTSSSSVATDVRRTKSDVDIAAARMALPPAAVGGIGDSGGGEFYTAVGPDGKEIILRRYLNDQGGRPVL